MQSKLRRVGIQQIIASGVCFSSLGVLGKLAYDRGVSTGELLAMRFILAAFMVFSYLLISNPRRLRLAWGELLSCAFLGVFGYALFAFCFFRALKGLSVSLSILLLYTYPILVLLGSRLFLGEKIPLMRLTALPLVLGGTVALFWGQISMHSLTAFFLGLLAALLYAGYIIFSSRLLKSIPAETSIAYIQGFAGLILGITFLHSLDRLVELMRLAWWILLLISSVGTILAMGLFLSGLQKLKNWEVALLSATEPLAAVGLAVLILKERLTPIQLIGGLAIIAGIIVVAQPVAQRSRHKLNYTK